jgi:hypothetical protein
MAEPTLTPGAAGAPGWVKIQEGDAWLLDTPLSLRPTVAVPLAQAQLWVSKMVGILDTTYAASWAPIFVSQASYNTLLADIAASGYHDFVNPIVSTRRGRNVEKVTARHDRHLHAAYTKYKDAIAQLVGPGLEEYKQHVREAQTRYRVGEALPISATGAYLGRFIEAAVKHVWWLVLNPTFTRYKSPLDYTEGRWPPEFPFVAPLHLWDTARQAIDLYIRLICQWFTETPMEKTLEDFDNFLIGALVPPYTSPPDSHVRIVLVDGIVHLRTLIALGGV